ncbi:Transcriptional regulator, contains XRE-family HTH domain [Lachnospiraceae bacterium XBB1006]|nr:Transcriptional regulator, contains XRE-family HTH domain [Lachnospiraceae bacterium XBB1006]
MKTHVCTYGAVGHSFNPFILLEGKQVMKEMKNIERGRRIVALREQRNMTQEQLADAMEISRGALSNIENGGDFKISTFESLMAALLVSPSQILYDCEGDKASIIEDITQELAMMSELELRKMLAGLRAANAVK